MVPVPPPWGRWKDLGQAMRHKGAEGGKRVILNNWESTQTYGGASLIIIYGRSPLT